MNVKKPSIKKMKGLNSETSSSRRPRKSLQSKLPNKGQTEPRIKAARMSRMRRRRIPSLNRRTSYSSLMTIIHPLRSRPKSSKILIMTSI